MLYIWIKALHIIFMVTWFAGLFYLPRLFVYHAVPENRHSFELFKVMERRLFVMMTIGATLTLFFGVTLLVLNPGLFSMGWFHAKLFLLLILFTYHYACYRLMITFREDQNKRGHKWFRYFNEAPSLLLILIVILAVTKLF